MTRSQTQVKSAFAITCQPLPSSTSSCQNSHFLLLWFASLCSKQQHTAPPRARWRVRREVRSTGCRYIFIIYQSTPPFTAAQLIPLELGSQVLALGSLTALIVTEEWAVLSPKVWSWKPLQSTGASPPSQHLSFSLPTWQQVDFGSENPVLPLSMFSFRWNALSFPCLPTALVPHFLAHRPQSEHFYSLIKCRKHRR